MKILPQRARHKKFKRKSKWGKCCFAKREIERLGYKDHFLVQSTNSASSYRNLAELWHPLRLLFTKSKRILWKDNYAIRYDEGKAEIAQTTETKQWNPSLETRARYNASRQSQGAALNKLDKEAWKTIACTFPFLTSVETRYSVNKLNLWFVVWAIERFIYYLYGKKFTVITDHRALLSVMKKHSSNKSYESRMTHWFDISKLLNFEIEYLAGTRMVLVDYILRKSCVKYYSIWPNTKYYSIWRPIFSCKVRFNETLSEKLFTWQVDFWAKGAATTTKLSVTQRKSFLKTNAINDSSKVGNSTKNAKQNVSNLIASNQLDKKSENFELISNFRAKSKNKTPQSELDSMEKVKAGFPPHRKQGIVQLPMLTANRNQSQRRRRQ